MAEPAELATIRRLLLLVLAGSAPALGLELVLLEHFESGVQWIPLITLGVAFPLTLAVLSRSAPRLLVLGFRAAMVTLVLVAFLGLYFHYTGNAEFELEMDASLHGWTLVRESLHGATPALAPGTLALFGLIGLIATWRHPALRHAENPA